MLLLAILRRYITIIPKSSVSWGKCMIYVKSKSSTNWAWWDLGVALLSQNPSWRSAEPSSNDHLTVIYYLKSLYRPYNFRRKLMKELFILMRPLRLYRDNPTTLISKCMPQYWLISLKSLHYKSVINPSRIFTYHCHGGWSLCLRLSTNTHTRTKAMQFKLQCTITATIKSSCQNTSAKNQPFLKVAAVHLLAKI